jgi:hypothetical protein
VHAVRGDLRSMSLPTLVQALSADRTRGTLRVVSPHGEGFLSLDDGDVIEAAAGHLTGEEAVYLMLGWHEGSFELLPNESLPPRAIQQSVASLLLEGFRRLDELGKRGKESLASTPAPFNPVEALLEEMRDGSKHFLAGVVFDRRRGTLAALSADPNFDTEPLQTALMALWEGASATVTCLSAAPLGECLLVSERALVLLRPAGELALAYAVEAQGATLGNLRLFAQTFGEKLTALAGASPHDHGAPRAELDPDRDPWESI